MGDAERKAKEKEAKKGGREGFKAVIEKAKELNLFSECSIIKAAEEIQKHFGTDPRWKSMAEKERNKLIAEVVEEEQEKRKKLAEAVNSEFKALVTSFLQEKKNER